MNVNNSSYKKYEKNHKFACNCNCGKCNHCNCIRSYCCTKKCQDMFLVCPCGFLQVTYCLYSKRRNEICSLKKLGIFLKIGTIDTIFILSEIFIYELLLIVAALFNKTDLIVYAVLLNLMTIELKLPQSLGHSACVFILKGLTNPEIDRIKYAKKAWIFTLGICRTLFAVSVFLCVSLWFCFDVVYFVFFLALCCCWVPLCLCLCLPVSVVFFW